MKKILILFVVLVVLLVSCNKKEGIDMKDVFYGNFEADDSKTLDEVLTKEYDLIELQSFFSNNMNEDMGFNSDDTVLTFNEVNNKYPIEIIRTNGYTVYKVIQGGYFYVFWVKPFQESKYNNDIEPSVYFSAYLDCSKDEAIFNSIEIGNSSAEDVSLVDPSLELSFLLSNGIYTYSYLNNNNLMQIEYERQGEFNDFNDLIVKNKLVVNRKTAPSRFSSILSQDLPN